MEKGALRANLKEKHCRYNQAPFMSNSLRITSMSRSQLLNSFRNKTNKIKLHAKKNELKVGPRVG